MTATATTTTMKTTMVAGFAGGASVRRIRTPTPQDVLSGRGGGINSHKGNKAFREWVNQRKEEYNLAQNKKEKIAVAMQVVRQVQQQVPVSGRFLTRDPTVAGGSGGQWWVEIDEAKALAKTTQALREGAPKIRQAHQIAETSPEKTAQKPKKRKRKAPVIATAIETTVMDDDTEKFVLQTVKQDASSLPRYKSELMLLPTSEYSVALEQLQENVEQAKHEAEKRQHQEQQLQPPQATAPMTSLVAPLTSNKRFNQMYGQQKEVVASSKSQFNPLSMPAVDPFAETPPLMAAPDPDGANNIPVLSLDSSTTIFVDGLPAEQRHKRRRFPRVHSLALSDYDGTNLDPATDELVEFVNPFADESNVLTSENDASVVRSHVPASVFNHWNKMGNGSAGQDKNDDATDLSILKRRSIGVSLNRILSFTTPLNDSDASPRFWRNTENQNYNDSDSNDYFFHDDDIAESDCFEGSIKSTFDVVPPDVVMSPDNKNKNSTSNLIRRTSFTARNRGLVNGRQ